MKYKYICKGCNSYFYEKPIFLNENAYEIKQYYCNKCNLLFFREEVKEETLEEKFFNKINNLCYTPIPQGDIIPNKLSQISKKHFLKIFDEVIETCQDIKVKYCSNIIREALENA